MVISLLQVATLILSFFQVNSYTKCISIYGLETEARNFVCSWAKPVEYYVDKLNQVGFNTLRIPFSMQYIEENNFNHLDHVVNIATQYNISVVLDMHRIFDDHQDATPFDHGVTKERFINAWLNILGRYYYKPVVKSCNVYNEYQGTDIQFLTQYSKEVLLAMEKQYPNRYTYYLTGYAWGGSLDGFSVEDLYFSDRINYSIHQYWFSVPQGANPDTYDYETNWKKAFGNNTNQLVIGEWGFKNEERDMKWAKRFIAYLKKNDIRNTCFWTISLSTDTDGLWKDDCLTFDYEKFSLLQTLWIDRRLRGFPVFL